MRRKALDAGGFGGLREFDGAFEIDLVSPIFTQIADRIVTERGEMDDGVEAFEIGFADIAQILAGEFFDRFVWQEFTGVVIAGIEADDVVAFGAKDG
jgi:hypothetical protein